MGSEMVFCVVERRKRRGRLGSYKQKTNKQNKKTKQQKHMAARKETTTEYWVAMMRGKTTLHLTSKSNNTTQK